MAAPDSITSSVPCIQEPGVGEPAPGLLEDHDNELADRLALGLRAGDTGQALEERIRRRTGVDEIDAERAVERPPPGRGLAQAHEAGVDEHASSCFLPMARCTSAATAAESTLRTSPQIARPEPTWTRIPVVIDDVGHRPGLWQPHTLVRNRTSRSWPCIVVTR
ncbi:MAG: hypothetical protein R2749_11455 [Acidimicrobiales bacterium]